METSHPAAARRLSWLVVVGLLGLAAAVLFGWRALRQERSDEATVAYLIASKPGVRIHLGWRRLELITTRTVAAGSTLKLPAGARTVLLDAATGVSETLTGPVERTFAKVSAGQREERNVDHLQGPLEAWLSSLPTDLPESPRRGLPLYAPVGVTRVTAPQVAWEARAGLRYDAAIRDPDDERWPARLALNVVPPVELTAFSGSLELRADRIYEILVRETGAELVAGAGQFLVAANATPGDLPTDPAECLREAAAALAARPYRTGDAWTVLSRLPPAWAGDELVVRLRLKCAIELGSSVLFRAARADAEKLLAR